MAVEIERKFLVAGDGWRESVSAARTLRQAYLTKEGRLSIRVRIDGPGSATLTIKSAEAGVERAEFEYPIPVADAEQMMERCEGSVIVKTRHEVPLDGLVWEIDVFEGDNAGLVVAELELTHADQEFARPAWLGAEITHERRYYNAELAARPFCKW